MRKGLYANIHAKRKRGEKMRNKGAKGAPTSAQFKRAAQTVRKKQGGKSKMNPKDMKFNGKSDNRNNRTTNFKLDTAKADLDKDGKLSSYEKTRGMAIQKNMKKV